MTIVDNIVINQRLSKLFINSVIIFICLEVVVVFTASKLTKWITTPVDEAFIKQKNFIADASHELKTPLAVIMASSEAYEKDKNLKWIKNIQNESERMNKLILSLLDLAKSENINKELSNINLSKVVNKSVLTFESLIYEKNIKLTCNIEDNLFFKASEDDIKELMSILIDNAVNHSDKNGEIKINLIKNKNAIILDVINKGKGIKQGEEEKIFERFYKADKSRNRNSNRYGLGLAIAKNIVTNLGGIISANSNDGYTTFKVILKK